MDFRKLRWSKTLKFNDERPPDIYGVYRLYHRGSIKRVGRGHILNRFYYWKSSKKYDSFDFAEVIGGDHEGDAFFYECQMFHYYPALDNEKHPERPPFREDLPLCSSPKCITCLVPKD
jgi:hypothetical protein